MAYASSAYGLAPYAAPTPVMSGPPPGQQTLPPPIPGGTNTWIYAQTPQLAYGIRGYAGRQSTLTYPGGGVSIAPVPERGVMTVTAWWPDARLLSLVRIHADGTVHPVRGANPLLVTADTRRNYCTNPSFEVGLNGYTPDVGSPVLARVTDGTAPRGGSHLTATVAGAGSLGIAVPQAMPPGRDSRIALDLKFSAKPSSVTIQIGWADSLGIALPVVTAALSADDVNRSIGIWGRQSVLLVAPSAGVTPTVKVIAAGMPAGGVMSVDGVLIGSAADSGEWFDGGMYGAQWLGVTGLSVSILAPVLTFDDGECPVDEPVSYRLVNAVPTGGSMTSALSQLDSDGRVWITHPGNPGNPREAFVQRGRPELVREARQGLFQAINDDLMTTVSAAKRTAPAGALSLWSFSFHDNKTLVALLSDLAPILLRTPAELGFDAVSWISVGTLTESVDGAGDYQGYLKQTGPFFSVGPPPG